MADHSMERKSSADATVSAYRLIPVTPSDTAEFPTCQALYIGADGNLEVTMNDGAVVTGIPVFAGQVFPIQCYQVRAATTATPVFAMYS